MTGFAEVEPWRAHMDVLARKLDGLVEEHASLEADVKHAWMGC